MVLPYSGLGRLSTFADAWRAKYRPFEAARDRPARCWIRGAAHPSGERFASAGLQGDRRTAVLDRKRYG
jgi:hypothetical protein